MPACSLIEQAYEGAAGAVLVSELKYDEAISHLEQDTNNPLSLQLLKDSYQKTGNRTAAKRTSDTLANLNDSTLEQAMVVCKGGSAGGRPNEARAFVDYVGSEPGRAIMRRHGFLLPGEAVPPPPP